MDRSSSSSSSSSSSPSPFNNNNNININSANLNNNDHSNAFSEPQQPLYHQPNLASNPTSNPNTAINQRPRSSLLSSSSSSTNNTNRYAQKSIPTNSSSSTAPASEKTTSEPKPTATATSSTSQSTMKKKTLKRKLASCSGCRKRRTRCDRIVPCSECLRRNTVCDYEGASLPPIAARRDLSEKAEREKYIRELEEKVKMLEEKDHHHHHHHHHDHHSSGPSSPQPEIDFSTDDLAFQLSTIALGQRVKTKGNKTAPLHPLQAQFESLLSSGFAPPPITFFESDDSFTLDLVTAKAALPLQVLLSQHLPTRAQIDLLTETYLQTLNLWTPSINPIDWSIQFNRFWAFPNRLQFRPSPETEEPLGATVHRLAHFVSCIFAISAQGLLRHADIHKLKPEEQEPPLPPLLPGAKSLDPQFRDLTQTQMISLAHRWLKYAMGLLVGAEGQVFVKPTIFGIRAMALLCGVELAPENMDRGIFFWSLTSNSAASAGLLNEPPVTEEESADMLDDYELESRRHLFWALLGLDWAGATIGGGVKYRCDPSRYDINIPGTTPSPAIELDPIDGWPVDRLTCIRKAAAMSDRVMHKASLKLLAGQPATYNDVLESEKQILDIEELIPLRMQWVMSPDGQSIRPRIDSDYLGNLLALFMAARLSTSRLRLHRLFILPRPGVPIQERKRHMKSLMYVSRRHFLATPHFPHSLNMHPLMLYSLICTATACALAVLMGIREGDEDLIAEIDFFVPQLENVSKLFSLAKRTVASSLARKSVTLLDTLMGKMKEFAASRDLARERKKRGPAAYSQNGKGGEVTESLNDRRRKVPVPIPDNPTTQYHHRFNGTNEVIGPGYVRTAPNSGYPVVPHTSASDHFPQATCSPSSTYPALGEPQLQSESVASWINHRPVAELPRRVVADSPARFGNGSPEKPGHLNFSFQQLLPSALQASTSSSSTSSGVLMTSSSTEFSTGSSSAARYASISSGSSAEYLNFTTHPNEFNGNNKNEQAVNHVSGAWNSTSPDTLGHYNNNNNNNNHQHYRSQDFPENYQGSENSINVFDPDFWVKIGIAPEEMMAGGGGGGGVGTEGGEIGVGVGVAEGGGVGYNVTNSGGVLFGGGIGGVGGGIGGGGDEALSLVDPFQTNFEIGWSPGDSLGSNSPQNLNSKDIGGENL